MNARAQVISEEYLKEQQKLHQNPDYGTASIQFAPIVKQVIEKRNIRSLSDYGAGKQNLIWRATIILTG